MKEWETWEIWENFGQNTYIFKCYTKVLRQKGQRCESKPKRNDRLK